MPAKRRLTLRQLRQMLRLAGSGTSSREIVLHGVARSTVQDNLKRAAMAGLTWPLPGELTDDSLGHRLFARAGVKQGQRRRQEPVWAELSIELRKPGVTLLILWEEYRSVHPDGYGYSRFCELFRGFEQASVADDAPGARSRRQGLCELFRQEGADRRSQDR